MNTNNIEVNTQSSIRLELDKIIYFDPFQIKEDKHDADIIFITHEHYDHLDKDSIEKIKKDNTLIIAPKSMEKTINEIEVNDYKYLNPNEEINIDNINIKTIPAYNIDKDFHPKENNWLGYIITYNNITYYIAGDTDKTIDNESVKCDIAFLPIGGYYTMDASDASNLAKIINPKVVIPIHYGTIVGNKTDADELIKFLSDTNIEVVKKINF